MSSPFKFESRRMLYERANVVKIVELMNRFGKPFALFDGEEVYSLTGPQWSVEEIVSSMYATDSADVEWHNEQDEWIAIRFIYGNDPKEVAANWAGSNKGAILALEELVYNW